MGIFQHKKVEDGDGPLHFFDDYYREELRKKGREYFEKAIDDDATIFKKDLDTLISDIKGHLDEHITKQLDASLKEVTNELTKKFDERLDDYGKAMKDAQDGAIKSLEEREKAIEHQHAELSTALKHSVEDQEKMLVKTYQDTMSRIIELKDAQATALKILSDSTKAIEHQQLQLQEMLQQNIAKQEARTIAVFEQNMAKVVEHYLLGALGDEFDLKSQLPSIIKQLESNKKDMVEDMKL